MTAPGAVAVPPAGSERIVVDGLSVRVTHLDRVVYPATGFTKADVLRYYLAVADVLLPHLSGRPVTVGRFPAGVGHQGFAQTDVPGRPAWVRTVPLELASGVVRRFTVVDDRATLLWLAQMGTIELHTFLGAVPDLERPLAVIFDLDPATADGLLDAAAVARRLRDRLADLGLEAFAKTSGAAGMHVFVPAGRMTTYAETRALAQRLASELAAELPHLVTDRLALAARAGRVLIDVRQNSRRLTTVAPYSLRATPRPTASLPVTWEEVEDALTSGDPRVLVLEAPDVIARVRRLGDPLAGARP